MLSTLDLPGAYCPHRNHHAAAVPLLGWRLRNKALDSAEIKSYAGV